jgi:hypothetical protein
MTAGSALHPKTVPERRYAMLTSPHADEPTICACPGCEEIVEQPADPGVTRIYHSRKCRTQARRLRREGEFAAMETVAVAPGPAPVATASSAEAIPVPAPAQASTSGRHRLAPGEFSPPLRHLRPSRLLASLRRRRPKVAVALLAIAIALVGVYLTQRSTGAAKHALPPSAAGRYFRPLLPGGTATTLLPDSRSPAAAARTGHTPRSSPKASLIATGSESTPAATRSASPHPSSSPKPSPKPSPRPSPQKPPKASPNSVLISFENGTAGGWAPTWGNITSTISTRTAYDGTHALLLQTSGNRYSAIDTTSSIQGLRTGDQVVYHIWSNGQAGGVRPFVEDGDFGVSFGQPGDTPLPSKAGWFTLTWKIPSVSSLQTIGMQVTNPGSGKLTLAVDALSWPR